MYVSVCAPCNCSEKLALEGAACGFFALDLIGMRLRRKANE